MERKDFMSAIITLLAGVMLTTAVTAVAAEQSLNPGVAMETGAGGRAGAVKADDKGREKAAVTEQGPNIEAKEAPEDAISVDLKIPFFSPLVTNVPLASVSNEKITVQDLRNALMTVHEKMTREKETTAKKAFLDTLQRLINVKLVVLEATNMELDKLPEIKADLDRNAEIQLRQVLFQERVKDLKPDEAEVDKVYKEMIQEWKLKSILFHKESDAKKFVEDMKAGKSFDELREKAIKEGKAEQAGQNEELYANKASLGPVLGDAVSNLKSGSVSGIINLTNSFVILKVEDARSVENPELKEKARSQVLSRARIASLEKYKKELYKQYIKENTKLIKSIDFDSEKPGLAKLLKDKRVIVSVKGDRSVTVAELAAAVRDKFYHGVELAIKKKKANREKLEILDEVISKRVFRRAALDKGLEKSEEYLKKLDDYRNSILFGIFIEKVVKPDVTISGQEVKAYYDEHADQYVFPQMLQVEDIVFKTMEDAQTAIDKLRQGVDFKWLKNNADGQVPKDAKGLLDFSGRMLTVKSFPEGLQKVLAGAKEGDYRLYESPEKYYYVIFVEKGVAARKQTFDEVKDDVAQKVTWQNFNKAIDEWFKKLREGYPVKIYLQEK